MIYILTVYDSPNYGSYLQALSLKTILEKYDKVAFLDIHHQSVLKQSLVKICGHIYRRRFAGISFEIKKYKTFKALKKKMPIVDMKNAESDSIYVFGSDEIWNVNRSKFLNSPEFFGIGLKSGYKIAYAPTINTVKTEDMKTHTQLLDGISKFDFISVRDDHSKNVLLDLIDNNITVVTDPTFIFGIDNFKKMQTLPQIKDKYVMIYTYTRMFKNDEQINAVISACHKRGYKIISVGKYFKWCDLSVAADPFEFLGYVNNAECVITDTFHGTVFSILYRKNFVEVNPAQKIKNMLSDFGLNNCVISNVTEIESIIDKKTDYSVADIKQAEKVEKSLKYLDNAVKTVLDKKENKKV